MLCGWCILCACVVEVTVQKGQEGRSMQGILEWTQIIIYNSNALHGNGGSSAHWGNWAILGSHSCFYIYYILAESSALVEKG